MIIKKSQACVKAKNSNLNSLFMSKCFRLILCGVFSIFCFSIQADAWLENDPNAIWDRSPGVYKEGNDWYVIFHALETDTNVQIYGDFTNGETNAVNLTRTPDGKFWWFKGTDASFSRAPIHGDEYRFKLTRDGVSETFQDPAARWVTHSGLDTGMSKINLTDDYQWQSNTWTRPTQEQLNIYQVHPLRSTDRNNATPFKEIIGFRSLGGSILHIAGSFVKKTFLVTGMYNSGVLVGSAVRTGLNRMGSALTSEKCSCSK